MRKNKRYKIYEQKKAELRRLNLPSSEYQKRIRELTKRIKV